MAKKSLRTFLRALTDDYPDHLFHVADTEVDPAYEIPSIIRQLQAEDRFPLVRCDEIGGHPEFSIVSNVCADRERIALALDSPDSGYVSEYTDRLECPLEPVKVDDGPVKEVVDVGDSVSLNDLPIVTHGAKEPAPYIDSGVLVVRDEQRDRYNTGIFRSMQIDDKRLAVNVGEGQHTYSVLERAENEDEPLEFAMYVGHHPAAIFGSQVRTTEDEYAAVGGVMGEPFHLVPCETVDLEVPAHAEIVLEGRFKPHERAAEGPFGEYHFLYGEKRESPVVEITAVTRREKPILYDIYNLYVDHVNHAVVPLEADIYRTCQEAVPETMTVHSPATASIFTAIVQVEKNRPGIAKQAGLAALSSNYYVRQVIVVDEEQDPTNIGDVLWALSMKTRPEEDIDFVKNAYIVKSDPMGVSEDGWPDQGPLNTKVIIDATAPVNRDLGERCEPPEEMWKSLNLDAYN